MIRATVSTYRALHLVGQADYIFLAVLCAVREPHYAALGGSSIRNPEELVFARVANLAISIETPPSPTNPTHRRSA